MNWEMQMNKAIEYIEDNLYGEIDYSLAARFMNCSEWEFRRIFSFITQIPLSEYVRRRRLSMAVKHIKNGEKIIDVALRCGYESPSAFSRAFSQLHGIAPSLARDKEVTPFPRLSFKLIISEVLCMDRNINYRPNIIGTGEVGYAVSVETDKDAIHKTNCLFWDDEGSELLGATALPKYGAFVTEEKCRLFGDVSGKKVLEIGCGNGHSLEYIACRKAAELWGLDISEKQIERTKEYLSSRGISAKLICSPMEEECGIPESFFDFVYSVYAIGWTTDIVNTFRRIGSYLKKDGIFIFSWSHPIHKCVALENSILEFKKCYFDESWYSVSLGKNELSLSDRKMSTYVNALYKAGFIIEEMVEQSDEDIMGKGDFADKARMLPVTFVIKARKL